MNLETLAMTQMWTNTDGGLAWMVVLEGTQQRAPLK